MGQLVYTLAYVSRKKKSGCDEQKVILSYLRTQVHSEISMKKNIDSSSYSPTTNGY